MSGTQWAPEISATTQLPAGATVGMAANITPTEQDIIALNASGYGVICDGTQSNARVCGVMYPDKRSTSSTEAGGNVVRLWNGYGARMPMSSAAGDAFTSNDRCAPCYVSDLREVGKLPTDTGIGRPLGGLTLGLDGDEAVTWLGDVAQVVARGLVIAEDFTFAAHRIADASASATISETVIGKVNTHGVVESVNYAGAAFAADNTDFARATIAKRSLADAYASATTIATFDSRSSGQGAATAFTPKGFALSATAANLRFVPGDVITLVTLKDGSGKSFVGVIDVVGKVI